MSIRGRALESHLKSVKVEVEAARLWSPADNRMRELVMDDAQILQQIEKLVDEERGLRDRAKDELAAEQHARLESLEIALDQCWDLLRQRRALREFGDDPESAHARDATTVERYEQ